MRKLFIFCTLIGLVTAGIAQNHTPPAMAAIRVEDLKKDMYDLADAHYRGRSAGTLDE